MSTIDISIEQLTLTERYDLLARIQETLPPPAPVFSEDHLRLLRDRKRAADNGHNASIDYDTAMGRLRTKPE